MPTPNRNEVAKGDHIVAELLHLGFQVTRENWIKLAHLDTPKRWRRA
jgi:hypothetical protein